MSEYDELCRVVLTGAARTGKSSLMNSYVGDSFNESYMATIGTRTLN
jgi:GTPase SAR1 family protein